MLGYERCRRFLKKSSFVHAGWPRRNLFQDPFFGPDPSLSLSANTPPPQPPPPLFILLHYLVIRAARAASRRTAWRFTEVAASGTTKTATWACRSSWWNLALQPWTICGRNRYNWQTRVNFYDLFWNQNCSYLVCFLSLSLSPSLFKCQHAWIRDEKYEHGLEWNGSLVVRLALTSVCIHLKLFSSSFLVAVSLCCFLLSRQHDDTLDDDEVTSEVDDATTAK